MKDFLLGFLLALFLIGSTAAYFTIGRSVVQAQAIAEHEKALMTLVQDYNLRHQPPAVPEQKKK